MQKYVVILQPTSIEYSLYYEYFYQQVQIKMLINELAKQTGVSIHTLRYYENFGFFKGFADENVKTNNYKNYDDSLVETVALIKEAKEVGFTLSEIKYMLDSWTNNKLSADKKTQIINTKISEIDLKIRQLKQVKSKLSKVLTDIENGDC